MFYSAIQVVKRLFHKFECNYCGSSFSELELDGIDQPVIQQYDIVGAGRRSCKCPKCGINDRSRLALYYFNHHTDLISEEKDARVLIVAPEYHLYEMISKQKGISVSVGDIVPSRYEFANAEYCDLTDLSYPDEIFDWVICNHVLEHIPDDNKALSEIYRVLKKGGSALLQVPISLKLNATLENSMITEPKDRLANFGQEDHVRIYGQDFIDRLMNANFSTRIFDPNMELSESMIKRLAINRLEKLYVVYKP